MFNPNLLPPDEKRLYDDTIHDAIIRSDGTCRPTSEAGERLYDSLNALADTYHWAHELLIYAARQNLGKRAKEWAKSQQFVDTPFGSKKVSKSAYFASKRRDDEGAKLDQLELWENATVDDLVAVIRRDTTMRDGIEVEMSIAVRLLKLCKKHDVQSVADALHAEGTTLQEVLDPSDEETA